MHELQIENGSYQCQRIKYKHFIIQIEFQNPSFGFKGNFKVFVMTSKHSIEK